MPAIKEGKTIMICGHGNIIRSMLKRLDNIPKSVLKKAGVIYRPFVSRLVLPLDEVGSGLDGTSLRNEARMQSIARPPSRSRLLTAFYSHEQLCFGFWNDFMEADLMQKHGACRNVICRMPTYRAADTTSSSARLSSQ